MPNVGAEAGVCLVTLSPFARSIPIFTFVLFISSVKLSEMPAGEDEKQRAVKGTCPDMLEALL